MAEEAALLQDAAAESHMVDDCESQSRRRRRGERVQNLPLITDARPYERDCGK